MFGSLLKHFVHHTYDWQTRPKYETNYYLNNNITEITLT